MRSEPAALKIGLREVWPWRDGNATSASTRPAPTFPQMAQFAETLGVPYFKKGVLKACAMENIIAQSIDILSATLQAVAGHVRNKEACTWQRLLAGLARIVRREGSPDWIIRVTYVVGVPCL